MAENKESSSKESESFQDSVVKESFVESVNVKEMDIDDNYKRVLEPYFLRRVLRKELDSSDVNDMKLLVAGVHAVFLESGFVGFDSVSGLRIDGFDCADSNKILYTLPELLGNGSVKNSVYLKFQSVGQFITVYGTLAKGGSRHYRVTLDENRFSKALTNAWKNPEIDEDEGSLRLDFEKEIFEFRKIVKDGLALPLLIDLCDKTGLALPPCFTRLPAELKLKILECLPGVDVARMECVCTEMKYLSSKDDDLWKRKATQEFKIICHEQKNPIRSNRQSRHSRLCSRSNFITSLYPTDGSPFGASLGTDALCVGSWKLTYASIWQIDRKTEEPKRMLRPLGEPNKMVRQRWLTEIRRSRLRVYDELPKMGYIVPQDYILATMMGWI